MPENLHPTTIGGNFLSQRADVAFRRDILGRQRVHPICQKGPEAPLYCMFPYRHFSSNRPHQRHLHVTKRTTCTAALKYQTLQPVALQWYFLPQAAMPEAREDAALSTALPEAGCSGLLPRCLLKKGI